MSRCAAALLLLVGLAVGQAAAAEVTLEPGSPLTRDAVAGLIEAGLRARGVAGDVAVEVRSPAGPVPTRAVTPMRVGLDDLRYDERTGRYRAVLAATLSSGETTSIPTSGLVTELVRVPVPVRPIARDQTVRGEDLELAMLAGSSLARDALRRPEDMVGQQASRALPAGRPVRAGDLAAPWLLRRGDDASVVFRRGGLQIVGSAVALENGRRGETIRVRNAASGELRRATVVGPRQLEAADPGLVP